MIRASDTVSIFTQSKLFIHNKNKLYIIIIVRPVQTAVVDANLKMLYYLNFDDLIDSIQETDGCKYNKKIFKNKSLVTFQLRLGSIHLHNKIFHSF